MTIKEKAESLLSITRKAPKMFSGSRESIMNRVVTILEMVEIDFDVIEFYKKHLGINGCAYATWSEDFTDDWAHYVIDDALELLKEHND